VERRYAAQGIARPNPLPEKRPNPLPVGSAPPQNDRLQQFVGETLSSVEQLFRAQVRYACRRCESPIEELFAAAIVLHASGARIMGVDLILTEGAFDRDTRSTQAPGTNVYFQADIGAYRVDFLFDDLHDGKRRLLVVELDGHDWHERTKSQATRDKKRDRALVAAGYRILRFTGSETFAAPGECLNEVIDAILAARREL
jgi:very-short-patch-repair endonuclease